MELQEIQQIPQHLNNRLKRRTWVAVGIVTAIILVVSLFSTYQDGRRAKRVEYHNFIADSVRHEEHLMIIKILLENQEIFTQHSTGFSKEKVKLLEQDNLYLENLEQQKK